MTAQEALQIVEQARMVISLNGKEADLLRDAVITINNFIIHKEEEVKELKSEIVTLKALRDGRQ